MFLVFINMGCYSNTAYGGLFNHWEENHEAHSKIPVPGRPWLWVPPFLALDASQGPRDMTPNTAIRFYAKGDGQTCEIKGEYETMHYKAAR